jgi:hypothetical protein
LHVAYAAHPERFVRQSPRPPAPPAAVWINPPSRTAPRRHRRRGRGTSHKRSPPPEVPQPRQPCPSRADSAALRSETKCGNGVSQNR